MGLWQAVVMITLFLCITGCVICGLEAWSGVRKLKRQPVDAEQLLAERYARGEVDEAEYAQRLSVLRMGPPLGLFFDK